MTASTLSAADLTAERGAFRQFLGDVWVLTSRSLARIRREPETLSDVTIQPVIFVLMFAYVFGGAINVPGGGDYHSYLIGGMLGMGRRRPHQAPPSRSSATWRPGSSTASARCRCPVRRC